MSKMSEFSSGGLVLETDELLALRAGGNILVNVAALATQDSSTVAFTGGTIDGTTLGATTPSSVAATTGSFSSTLGVTGAATFSSTVAGAFNGTLGATTPATVAATTLSTTGAATFGAGLTLTAASANIASGTANTGGSLSNSDVSSYVLVYGATNPTYPGGVQIGAGAGIHRFLSTGLSVAGTLTTTGAATFGGAIALPNVSGLLGRNAANSGNVTIAQVDALDVVRIDPSAFGTRIGGATTFDSTIATTGAATFGGNVQVNGSINTNLQSLSAWTANTRAIELTTYGAVSSNDNTGTAALSVNAYESSESGWSRVAGTTAARFQTNYLGEHKWSNAIAGIAGSAIYWVDQMTLDASGNLGLGVVPSAWGGTAMAAIDLGTLGSVSGSTTLGTSLDLNAYFNGTSWIYKNSLAATSYLQDVAGHYWKTAAAGTAGTVVNYDTKLSLSLTGVLTQNSDSAAAYFHQTEGGISRGYIGSANSLVSGGLTEYCVRGNTGIVFSVGGAQSATLDASGNLGLGVVPSAWRSGAKALQSGGNGLVTLWEQANGSTNLGFGVYESASNVFNYTTTGDTPTLYSQVTGVHKWFNAPSGTAGNPITFTQAMTLDASGNLLVGKTSVGLSSAGFEAVAAGTVSIARADTTLQLNRLSTDGEIAAFYKDTVKVGSIGSVGGAALAIASANSILYLNSSTYIAGALTTTGAATFGGATTALSNRATGAPIAIDGTLSQVTSWVSGTIPLITLSNSANTAGSRNFDLRTVSDTLQFHKGTDTYSSSTQLMTLDASGSLAVTGKLSIADAGSGTVAAFRIGANQTGLSSVTGNDLKFLNNGVTGMTLDDSGNLVLADGLISVSSSVGADANNNMLTVTKTAVASSLLVNAVSLQGYSSAACAIQVGQSGGLGRSINAGGTVNASGADYAEYEQNNGLTISKGSVVGFKSDGTLTLTFSEAVRFAIKSTDPSYVGGDVWGSEEQVGAKPIKPAEDAEQSEIDQYEADLAVFEQALEAARQLVDRIAYSGKVPVNVQGATAGDYIIAVAADDGSIDGQAVSDPDFAQYKLAVGRVNRILDDGRAEVAVIIH